MYNRQQGSSELDSSPKRSDKIKKSILKSSPANSDTNINKSLRAALIERDEKRIQFNVDKDEEKLELQVIFKNRSLLHKTL